MHSFKSMSVLWNKNVVFKFICVDLQLSFSRVLGPIYATTASTNENIQIILTAQPTMTKEHPQNQKQKL